MLMNTQNPIIRESLENLKQYMIREGWDWEKYESGDLGEVLQKAGLESGSTKQGGIVDDYIMLGAFTILMDEANTVLNYRDDEIKNWITATWSSIITATSDPNVTSDSLANSLAYIGVSAVGKTLIKSIRTSLKAGSVETTEEFIAIMSASISSIGISLVIAGVAALGAVVFGVLSALSQSPGTFYGAFLNMTDLDANLGVNPYIDHGVLSGMTGDTDNKDIFLSPATLDQTGCFASIPVGIVLAKKNTGTFSGGLYGVGGGFSLTFSGINTIGYDPTYITVGFETPYEGSGHSGGDPRATISWTPVPMNEDIFKETNENYNNYNEFVLLPGTNLFLQMCKYLDKDNNANYTIGAFIDTSLYPTYSKD